jgi:cold shock CspA family protein
MQPILDKGRLITWKDDRGFGFIESNNGGKDVFLHISVLPETSRRPKVGDIILYQRVITPKGKVRASKASIQGVTSQFRSTHLPKHTPSKSRISHRSKHRSNKSIETVVVAMLTMIGLGIAIARFGKSPAPVATDKSPAPVATVPQSDCNIKGNISINTSKRLYHMPGMEDYSRTNISPEHGERWFCSEEDAIANGWSKAPR